MTEGQPHPSSHKRLKCDVDARKCICFVYWQMVTKVVIIRTMVESGGLSQWARNLSEREP